MEYPVVIHHDEGSAYGVTVPDLPGCFSASDTFGHVLENARKAIELHLEGLAEAVMDIPVPTQIDAHRNRPDYAGGLWGLVEVDIMPFLGKAERINVTLPRSLIRRIDARYKDRSRFLAEAALKEFT